MLVRINNKIVIEGKVKNNQTGYVGQSMSVRARNAYQSGEKPKSKWTKSVIMEELEDLFGDAASGFSKFSKQDLFDNICRYSSYHHTGLYANVTNFYSVNREDAILFADNHHIESMIPVIENDDVYQKQKALREKARANKEKEDRERQAEKENKLAYIKELYKSIPKTIAESLTPIEEFYHRGDQAYHFTFAMPCGYMIEIHAYTKDLSELESLYEELKEEKRTEQTKDVYLLVSEIEYYIDPKFVTKGEVYICKNVKQQPFSSIRSLDQLK